MKRANVLGAALVVAGLTAVAGPASAQVTLGADAGIFSDYVWRGITYTNKLVVQPDLYLTFPAGKASITVGGWGNLELGAYTDASDISENGSEGAGLAEFDWWAEVGFPVGEKATITAGATGYVFPNDDGFTSDFNTVELYGKVGLSVPLNPKLSVWYDVDKVDGAYFEGSVSHSFPASEAVSVTVGALAGFSAGQHADLDSGGNSQADFFNFLDNGFTHLDLSAAVPFTAGPFSISPAVHLVITGDEFTKFDSATGNEKDAKFWFGGTISWSRAFGGEEAAEE
ncbi:MAG: TorF family putative porin [Gemmatimonadales bacterium]